MARNTNKNTYNVQTRRAEYVSGSAARKLQTVQAVPQVERTRRQVETEEERRERVNKEQKINRANRVNLLFTAIVTGITVAIFAVCWQYLEIQTSVKANAAEVARLQSELTELTTDNDEMEVQINASIDYDSIYNTAIEELGMVYPKKGQVITFDAGESEYVKQYGEIPAVK